jgi:2-iminobutanoate/2-iminopropanoate deaminase
MAKQIIETSNAPAPIGPYSQAVKVGQTLYVSGQVPMNPSTGEMVTGSISEEAAQVMKNLQAILKEAGYDFQHVVKSTIFLRDMADFAAVNEVYGQYFAHEAPARETIAVAGLPRNAQVEISMIAWKD